MAVDPSQQRAINPVELLLPHSVTQPLLSIKFVWGIFTTAGGTYALVEAGSGGWSGVRTGVGAVTITFSPSFKGVPTVLATSSANETWVGLPTASTGTIFMGTAAAANDTRCGFLAIGFPSD